MRILYQRPFGFGQLRMESVAQLKPRRTDATEEVDEEGVNGWNLVARDLEFSFPLGE